MSFDLLTEDSSITKDFRNGYKVLSVVFYLCASAGYRHSHVKETRGASNEHGMHEEIWRRIVDRILELEKFARSSLELLL